VSFAPTSWISTRPVIAIIGSRRSTVVSGAIKVTELRDKKTEVRLQIEAAGRSHDETIDLNTYELNGLRQLSLRSAESSKSSV
jgi:hypothetical protein